MNTTIDHKPRRLGAIVGAGVMLFAMSDLLGGVPLPAAAATQRCTAGLDVWLNSEGSGAAGSVYYKLEFTNLSEDACSISGYPGVSATNLRGRKLGRAAVREAGQPPGLVTLAAGTTATASLRIVDAGNFPSASCHAVTAAGLRVFPPGLKSSRLVPFPFKMCSSTGPAVLAVRPLTRA